MVENTSIREADPRVRGNDVDVDSSGSSSMYSKDGASFE